MRLRARFALYMSCGPPAGTRTRDQPDRPLLSLERGIRAPPLPQLVHELRPGRRFATSEPA
jgi:hypothetical protein